MHVVCIGPPQWENYVHLQGLALFLRDDVLDDSSLLFAGISGAVNSVAPARAYAASVSQDRFVRLHSSFGPPAEVGQQQEYKGEVLEKTYVKVIPTAVVWDEDITGADGVERGSEEEDEDGADDVWDNMEDVESDPEAEARPSRRKVKKMAS